MKTTYTGGELYTPAFQELMDRELLKLEKFFKGDSDATISMSKEGKLFKTTVAINYRSRRYVIQKTGTSAYDTIKPCVSNLQEQIKASKRDKSMRIGMGKATKEIKEMGE